MNRDERIPDWENLLRIVQDDVMNRLRVAMPGIVEAINQVARTCTVQPAITEDLLQQDGSTKTVALPLLLDVPIVEIQGGGIALTMPLQPGDEVLVIIADKCFDAWWQSGGIGNQADIRFHDLSDGFAIPGISSQPRRLPAVSATSAQLRTISGTDYIELTAGGLINLMSPAVKTSGNLSVGSGATGSFTSSTGQVISVVNGIVTNID